MLSARWAHRSLLGFCVLLVLGVVTYAGWQGWLGFEAQAWLHTALEPLARRLPNYEMADRIARVLGAAGTAMTAAYGVYKGLYYADRNLPERLKQILARTDERLGKDRQPLLAAISQDSRRTHARQSVFYVGPLNYALAELGFSKLSGAELSLGEALRELKEQIALSDCQKRNMEEQKVTAHILRGSIASARAEYDVGLGRSPDKDREAAEGEFTAALDIRPKNLDALELRGRQREIRSNAPGALADYEKLSEAATEAGALVRAARGYRLQGELLEMQGTRPNLDRARGRLDSGLKAINAVGSRKQDELFEEGLLYEAYGRVQIKRTRLPNARTHLGKALACFRGVKTQAARNREIDIEAMLRAIVTCSWNFGPGES